MTGITDKPLVTPTGKQELDSKEEIIRCGFRKRPLRDGGGKPSWGRIAPNLRSRSKLAEKGNATQAMALEASWDFAHSLASQQETQPFSEDLLLRIATVLGAELEVAHGQPFRLKLLNQLLLEAGDVDAGFPLELAEGLPLGVTNQLPRTEVWPSKEELSGQPLEDEDPPSLSSHKNYTSAEDHMEILEKTYEEEVLQGMVEGPCSLEEAAQICRCSPDELCFGALGAVEEIDKVRTIHDASVNSVNDHIRKNSLERTTAPTLMDGTHAIHWLKRNTGMQRGGATGLKEHVDH